MSGPEVTLYRGSSFRICLYDAMQIGKQSHTRISEDTVKTIELRTLTVRQLMNRLAENLGARGLWIWSGSEDQRFFFFFRLGVHH